jgi:hypothetical protein
MSKHTPGPWATDEADHDAPYQDIKIKAGKHRTVCTVWIDDAPVRDFNAEQAANARLIAAAPDLLEALTKLLDMHERCDAGFAPHVELRFAIRDMARAAIAKATGGAA